MPEFKKSNFYNESLKKAEEFLRKIEENTQIIDINLSSVEGKKLLEEFVQFKKGNFNEFLTEKFKEKFPEKIIVAKIYSSDSIKSLGINDKDKSQDLEITDSWSIDIEGADFSGSIISNLEIYSIKDVCFRDCHFENVRFVHSSIENVDFRGVSLENCEFFNFDDTLKLEKIKFDFANPDHVKDKGVFELISKIQEEKLIRLENRIKSRTEKEIAKIPKTQKRTLSWSEFFISMKGGNLAKHIEIFEYSQAELDQIEKIKADAEILIQEETQKIIDSSKLKFNDSICDPTYSRDMLGMQDIRERVYVEATKEMLDEFKKLSKKSKKQTFNEYVENYYQAKFPNKFDNKKIIAKFKADDLVGEDLSNLNLQGVDFSYLSLKNVKLDEANLESASFEGCEFNDQTSFQKANLTDANLLVSKGEGVNFENAIMIRTRINSATLMNSKMNNACLFAVNAAKADFSGSEMQYANFDRAQLKGAIMQSVDARYAKFRQANLEGVILNDAQLMNADLTKAVMHSLEAESANFMKAIMNEVKAEFANFSQANIQNIQAESANLSCANLFNVDAFQANFKKAVMSKIDAQFANFKEAIMEQADVSYSNFEGSCLEKIKAERVDIRNSVLKNVNAQCSNFRGSIMSGIDAFKANFTDAIMAEVNLEATSLVQANCERADFTDAKIDFNTLLMDANFRDAIGADQLRELQKEQHKISKWFETSKFGKCETKNGLNGRFQCQLIGANLLSAVIGTVPGLMIAGVQGAVISSVISGCISHESMKKLQSYYTQAYGKDYIDNCFGDKLAEIGALASVVGINTAEVAVNSALAYTICSSVGLLVPVPSFAEKLGFNSLINSAIKSLSLGVSFINGMNFKDARQQLSNYKEENGKVISGLRPEQIYQDSKMKFQELYTRLKPTKSKFLVAAACSILCVTAAVAVFVGISMLTGGSSVALTAGLIMSTIATNSAALTAIAVPSAMLGYYNEKFILDKCSKLKNGTLKVCSYVGNVVEKYMINNIIHIKDAIKDLFVDIRDKVKIMFDKNHANEDDDSNKFLRLNKKPKFKVKAISRLISDTPEHDLGKQVNTSKSITQNKKFRDLVKNQKKSDNTKFRG